MRTNSLNAIREFYVERFVDNMETKDLVQYVTDDMTDIWSHYQIMKSLMKSQLLG